jgi:hypothetical protein
LLNYCSYKQPERDGALENDIVVHENTHGVTNRLVGGGTARCLQNTEAGGMGEGEDRIRISSILFSYKVLVS